MPCRRRILSAGELERARTSRSGTEAPTRYDVFVSYRHGGVDKTFATELVSALEADGYRVAIDERDFPRQRQLPRGNGTLGSREPLHGGVDLVAVSRERQHASKKPSSARCSTWAIGKRRLIPIVIEPVSMPAWLYGIVGIDVTKRDPLVDPFDKLKATLGTPLANAPARHDSSSSRIR